MQNALVVGVGSTDPAIVSLITYARNENLRMAYALG
jgi:hypothetical protein